MKSQILKFFKSLLKNYAILTIKKYGPGVIGVTGSVGKTSAKEAIAAVLRGARRVRASRGNFNGDIGLPLTILGDWPDKDLKLLSRGSAPGKNNFKKQC